MARSRIVAAIAAGMIASATPSMGLAQAPDRAPQVEQGSQKNLDVQAARKYLDNSYNYGGRLTEKNPGIDCLGLMFLTLQDRYGIPWKNWSVTPSKLMDQLGKKTKTLMLLPADPGSDKDAFKNLKAGDFVFLLGYARLRDISVAKDREGADLYVWHTAISTGNGDIIHASPFKDGNGNETYRVIEEPLPDLMRRVGFAGLISVRFEGAKSGR